MPITMEISSDGRLALVTGSGTVDFDAFMETMNEVAADPSVSSDLDVIADFSRLDYTPSFKEIRKFGSSFDELRELLPSRVSIVVKDKTQLRLGRFAALVARMLRFEMSIVEDMEGARAWIARRREKKMNAVKAKILELWSRPQLAALATIGQDGNPHVRYVLTTATEDLTVRFATYKATRKVMQIVANPQVHLVAGPVSVERADRWVQLSGRAEISEAEEDRRLVWNEGLEAFFDGPDDPGYVVGVVRPDTIEYMEMGFSQPEVWHP